MASGWKKEPLFSAFWYDKEGKKHRLSRSEIGECYRLWAKHKDIRTGKHPMVHQGVKVLGSRSVLHV